MTEPEFENPHHYNAGFRKERFFASDCRSRLAQNDTLRHSVVILRSGATKNLSVIANTETDPLTMLN